MKRPQPFPCASKTAKYKYEIIAGIKPPSYAIFISKVKQGGDERATKTVHIARPAASDLLAGSCPLRSDSVVGEEANAVAPMKWNWNKIVTAVLVVTSLPTLSNTAQADTWDSFKFIDSKPNSEVWLNPGFYSYHFESDLNLNNNNLGFGAEYRYATIHSVTAGRFNNSDRQIQVMPPGTGNQ